MLLFSPLFQLILKKLPEITKKHKKIQPIGIKTNKNRSEDTNAASAIFFN